MLDAQQDLAVLGLRFGAWRLGGVGVKRQRSTKRRCCCLRSDGFGLLWLPLVLFGAVVAAGMALAYLSGTGRLR